MTEYQEFSDNDIQILGTVKTQSHDCPTKDESGNGGDVNNDSGKNGNKWKYVAIVLALLIIATAVLVLALPYTNKKRLSIEPVADTIIIANEITESAKPVDIQEAYINVKQDTINDIVIDIFTPVGCKPELYIGDIDTLDTSILLCAQAADVRGDNGMIVSACVYKGEIVSRGIAKKAFCAIIDGEITLGMAEETPLYERVIESQGDFFRQYPLVHDSMMQENKPKGKARRKALCMLDGKVCIIASQSDESFHDFAQALQDYGVSEAIALVGADSTLFYFDRENVFHNLGIIDNDKYENINYIVFKK